MLSANVSERVGWFGMLMLQSVSIPALIETLQGTAGIPIAMPIMTEIGLACYMVRALWAQASIDKLYAVGNSIGLLGNGVLIVVILAE